MPWDASSVDQYRKGLSRRQKKQWVAVANGALASCLEGGGDEQSCAGRAVRIANARFDAAVPWNPVLTRDQGQQMKHQIDAYLKYLQTHPDVGECEMEIFRPGTHNGTVFTDADLAEIAGNFGKLKDELRPKLKVTHREGQAKLAGLASYGDIVDVFLKAAADGTQRLWAKIANVPSSVLSWIKERRFPERSIELYPSFQLGTQDGAPVYRNVLKAVALLGHEMPAVTGMAPVALADAQEAQATLCCAEACAEPPCPCDDWAAVEVQLKLLEQDIAVLRTSKGVHT